MNDATEPQSITPELPLSPEQIKKSDRDIQTLVSFRDYLLQKNIQYALADGYAVEALCGGIITRPHGDMDVYIHVGDGDPKLIWQELEKLLKNEDHTSWKIDHIGEDGYSIEFRENDDTKSFEERRRIEVGFFGSDFFPRTQTRSLRDSQGKNYEFEVEHIEELTAAKIIKLVDLSQLSAEERERQGRRATRPSDVNEIKRLLESSELTDSLCLDAIKDYFLRGDYQLNEEESLEKAREYWDQVKDLIQNTKY